MEGLLSLFAIVSQLASIFFFLFYNHVLESESNVNLN